MENINRTRKHKGKQQLINRKTLSYFMFLKHLRTIKFIYYSCLIRYLIVYNLYFFLLIAVQYLDDYSIDTNNHFTPSTFIATPAKDCFDD